MISLEALEQRLAQLEQEVAQLWQRLAGPPTAARPTEWLPPMIREARAQQAAISAAAAEVFAQMGIVGEPVGVEKLHEMMRACGVRPEDNAFSREILAMREE